MAVDQRHTLKTITEAINEDPHGSDDDDISDDDYPVSDSRLISNAEVSDITVVTATSNNTTPKNLSES